MKFEFCNKPEDVGVSSAAIYEYLKCLEDKGVEHHGLLIIRYGKIAYSSFIAPYSLERPHSMYSCSKTFTATAIGFLIDEGKLSLDATVQELFPEDARAQKDARYATVHVRDLLRMASGKKSDMVKDMTRTDNLDVFFNYKWKKDNSFWYSNDDIYMLSEILMRITGESCVDYLTPRLFEPLGIKKPYWEATRRGRNLGYAGIYLSALDIAKVCWCYLHHGMYDGKQVIPEWWTVEASKIQNPVESLGTEATLFDGYGYGMWLKDGMFQFNGLYGQAATAYPEHDAVIVFLNADPKEKLIFEDFWRIFPSTFDTEGTEDDVQKLRELTEKRSQLVLPSAPLSPLAESLNGKTIRFKENKQIKLVGFPLSMLPFTLTCSMVIRSTGNLNDVVFDFKGDVCEYSWSEGVERNTALIGLKGEFATSTIRLGEMDYETLGSGYWADDRTFKAVFYFINTLAVRELIFCFEGSSVTMAVDGIPSPSRFFENQLGTSPFAVGNKAIEKCVIAGMNIACKVCMKKSHVKLKGKIDKK